MKSLNKQIGGNHYKGYKIEPIVYVCKNKIIHTLANVIKYASRANTRSNIEAEQLELKLEDLDKIIHYAEIEKEMAIEEYEEAHGPQPPAEIENENTYGTALTAGTGNEVVTMASRADEWEGGS